MKDEINQSKFFDYEFGTVEGDLDFLSVNEFDLLHESFGNIQSSLPINHGLRSNSSKFFLRESLKNSVTEAYPNSGRFFMNFSTRTYRSEGMLRVRYPLSIDYVSVRDNKSNLCYGYVMNNTNLKYNSMLSITYDNSGE